MACGTPDIQTVMRSYYDCVNYRSDKSVTKAREFAATVRILLSHPQRSQFGGVDGESMTFDTQTLWQMAKAADHWADNQSRVGRQTSYAGFTCLRR